MSDINESIENPNEKQAPGKPLDPDVIIPDDDDPADNRPGTEGDGPDDVDETSGGGLSYPDGPDGLAGHPVDDPDHDSVGSDDVVTR